MCTTSAYNGFIPAPFPTVNAVNILIPVLKAALNGMAEAENIFPAPGKG